MKFKGNWRQYRKYTKQTYLIVAVVLFVLGGFVAYMGNASGNALVIALGFGVLSGSFLLLRQWRRQGDIRYTGKAKKEGDKDLMPPNSLNLYPDRIEFAYVEEPKGQSQKCLNDGKYYHVHMENLVGELEEHRLPDDDESERYYDPIEFANPVTMPSNKRYFTWSISTMQKISLGVMGFIIFGEIIGLVVAGG